VLPWIPFPGPQAEAYLCLADELYYGGAAGGGKTQLIVGLSLTQHRNTLFLRRQQIDTKAISEVYRALPAHFGRWRGVGYGGEFRTPEGRLIEVGGCQGEDDWKKYAGHAHDLKAFDELPQFSERQYTTIIAWNRVRDPLKFPHLRCRAVGAGNPPTDPEGEWVLRRWGAWLDPTTGSKARPGELRWYVRFDGDDDEKAVASGDPIVFKGKTYQPKSRTFIPARVEDNPAYMEQGYAATLEALPEPLRSQLRYGDMAASRIDDRWQVIPTKWVAEAQKRFARRDWQSQPVVASGVDVAMGGIDWTVIAPLHAERTVGTLVKRRGRDTPDGQSVVALMIAAGVAGVTANIDTIGVGRSAYDVARVTGAVADPRAIVVSAATDWHDPKIPQLGFANVRAAAMWNVRVMLDPEGGPDETRLALPPDPELLVDLTAHRYVLRGGRIAIESKDEVMARIGRSPDAGDAVCLACWNGMGEPADMTQYSGRDPYGDPAKWR
jgi:hypothetical protein